MPYKPEGYTCAAPDLIARDPEATLAFLEAVFVAERLPVVPGASGGTIHAEARIGHTVVMMGEPRVPRPCARLRARRPATFARALAACGIGVRPPERKADGDLRGGVRDADGTSRWIANQ